jgi:hypothetical protein
MTTATLLHLAPFVIVDALLIGLFLGLAEVSTTWPAVNTHNWVDDVLITAIDAIFILAPAWTAVTVAQVTVALT